MKQNKPVTYVRLLCNSSIFVLFPYFLYIPQFTNSHVEALCLWKISTHVKIKSGKK